MGYFRYVLPLRVIKASWLLAVAGLLVGGPVRAVTEITTDIGTISAPGLTASGVSVTLRSPLAKPSARLEIKRLQLGPTLQITNVKLRCTALVLNSRRLACANAKGELTAMNMPAVRVAGGFAFELDTGELTLDISQYSIQGQPGSGAFKFEMRQGHWWLTARADALAAASLQPLLSQFGITSSAINTVALSKGELWFWLQAAGDATGLLSGKLKTRWSELSAANADSTIAAEALAGRSVVNFKRLAEGYDVQGSLNLNSGFAGVDPVYADFGQQPLALSFEAENRQSLWNIAQFKLRQTEKSEAGEAGEAGNLLSVDAEVEVDLQADKPLQQGTIAFGSSKLAALFPVYLQPLLLNTSFANATVSGGIQGSVAVTDGELQQANVNVKQVSIDNGNGQYTLQQLGGNLAWQRSAAPPISSSLSWQSGSLYKLGVGSAQLDFSSQNGWLRLSQPSRIPLADGALKINELRLKAGDGSELALDALLEPVSLKRLTERFGWPSFNGTISGRIPNIEYRQGVLTVGGVMQAELFGGTMRATDLRIDDLFGRLPKLAANLSLRDLNLVRVTDVFNFGRITGGLNADVEQLLLVGWRPAAFKARLYSPEKDPLPHKLSQRALDNIAEVGGAGAALSTPFIALFDNFSYDRIEWRCRLIGDVCNMDGIAAPGNGFYLVKGAGLPRVNVIGHTRRVDWPLLIKQITEAVERGEVSTGSKK